ncbi:MAG: AI-2E family transporter [Pirellulaceae bacterium]|nr:AI-2E family transporter [Pirellulaceae bacterium]
MASTRFRRPSPADPSGSRASATSPSSRPIWLPPLVFLAGLALLAVIWLTREVLLILFGGVLFGVFLCGLTNLVSRHTGLGRRLALTLVVLVLVAITAGGIWFLGAELIAQLDELRVGLQKSWIQILELWRSWPLSQWFGSEGAAPPSADHLQALVGALSSGMGVIAAPIVILVIGMFLAVDPGIYRRGLLELLPRSRHSLAQGVLDRAGATLWAWVWSRMFSMALVGLASLLGLWLLGTPLALTLALIAFVTNFIPYVGPVLSAIPAVLIAMTVNPTMAIYVLILYGIIQLIETNFITPLVEQQAVDLPPVFTLGAQLIATVLFGALGIVFATPLAAIVVELVKSLVLEDDPDLATDCLGPGA